jgi:two-component system, chemotaxis family, chemotaxis protein CheY
MRRPILVVDDTATIREMISAMLRPRGYRVSAAANGREGLARLRAVAEQHLILVDIVMPVLDGIGFWSGLQADPDLLAAGHHVVFMSTAQRLAMPDIPPSVGQLVKPFTADQLLNAVRNTEAIP